MSPYLPKLISRVEGKLTNAIITSEYWNELFNLMIEQGNYNASTLKETIDTLGVWPLGSYIVDENGVNHGLTKYLKFVNFSVNTLGETTTIVGTPGATGPQGATGITGPQGNPTPALHVLGLYPTLAALQIAHPTGVSGDAYAVGIASSNVIYVWDAALISWVNLGSLTGAPGTPGIQGIQGVQGVAGPGVVIGGTAGQVLTKVDGADFNTAWTSLPSTLQYLTNLDTNVKAKFTAIDLALSNVQSSITLGINKVVVSGGDGKLAVSTLDSTKLVHLASVSSDIQTQINNKLGSTAKATDSSKIDGRTVFVSASAPAGGVDGDVWFKV